MDPSILKHGFRFLFSSCRQMLTTEEARVKGEERMLRVAPIFCDEAEKVQNFTMSRMPPPLEGKVTPEVAS